LARRCTAMALNIHVDLHRHGSRVSRLPDIQRELQAGSIRATRCARSLADGSALFFLWIEAAPARTLQSAAETRIYVRGHSCHLVGCDRICYLETHPIFMARVDDGWVSLRPPMALHHYVGDVGVRFRAPGNGRCARLEQLCVDADRMEEGP